MKAERKNTTPFFGIKVKKRLIELDMTQRELAEQVGVNENYLTDILRGRRSGNKYREAIRMFLNLENDPDNNTNLRRVI